MKVGFIGLGGIGKPMAINVARSEYDLTVHDLREQPVRELSGYGTRVAASAREVAAAADIVFASLPSNAASREVALGPDGVLAGAKKGDIYVDLSTISPQVVHEIESQAAAVGVDMLDAPVSGGIAQRNEGRLSIMIGGDAATVARARPVIETFADKVFHVGATGAGATMKLVNNLLNGIGTVATMEALVLGVKAGLSVESMQEVISVSSGGSPTFRSTIDAVMNRDPEPPTGETAHMGLHTIGKDMALAADLAQRVGVSLQVGSSAVQFYTAGLGRGWADKENWVIMRLFEELSGVRVRPRRFETEESPR